MAEARGRVHLMGIGGVGMAGLAVLLKHRGWDVDGCDVHSGPRTKWLESQGVRVFAGHDKSHVELADMVVVTPAVRGDEPELVAARKAFGAESRRSGRGLWSRGEVLAELVSGERDSIAVCGSHGKTTTATWIAKLLIELGENVEWAIGGETGEFAVAGVAGPRASQNRVLVVEADESDGTLAGYRAKMLVVTNCEYDHPDHFKTREEYEACYDAARMGAGEVVEGRDLEPEVPEWLEGLARHNQKNAQMAIEVARRRGHSMDAIVPAMLKVVANLPDRRFQKLADGVYTDYAHHPTEMKCAIEMARKICRGTLRVMFQPHRYSRTKALLGDFPAAFKGADEVVVCPTYAAFERPMQGGSSADLYAACRNAGVRVKLARSCEEAWTHMKRSSKADDLVLVLGAGDILYKLSEVPAKRIWIGGGTNTWKSDLNLPVEYVKTNGPANKPGASLGIAWMAGIPGTIGGWVKMNAGAFGHSISEALDAVKIDGRWVPAAECGFGYRTSDIHGEIQDVRLKPAEVILSIATLSSADCLSRRKKFPAGTKGSVFKNPPNDFAGRLLEEAGCKGLRVGGAYVWSEHANVIVADDDATASDFLALSYIMRYRVWFGSGVWLDFEVTGL